ncbi:MAG TPA: hypothetical protein VFJ74_07115 [Gemmatimonadaceae bacterium]|nr:hypothetical protein [Gemmatimonadaceae bacterium]
MLRAIRGLRDGPPREDARRAWALASALTLLCFAVLGSAVVSVRDLVEPERPVAEQARATPERIVFVPVPPSAEQPVVAPSPSPSTATSERPRAVAAPRTSTVDSAGPATAPIAPSAAPRRDSTAVTAAPAPSSITTLEAPRAVFPTAACDLACRMRRDAAAAGGGGGTLTAAERDSLRRVAARRAREAQRLPAESPVGPTPPSTGAPVQQQGASVQVGLPGGGPTAAQRKRARELDAEVSARLARIKARADSLARVRDSTERKNR